jgi:methylated-DNA-protein-cysteine methyltransferase-like protein
LRKGQFHRIYAVVREIPSGKVATYGQVGVLATGSPFAARAVGWALHSLSPDIHETVPWWRVVNAQGRISTLVLPDGYGEQRRLLEAEGVVFSGTGRIDLARFLWHS